ncbi:hypothetical protein BCR34DRAFT_116320 [Clohesyomyces aquaticus]|uniref:Uncharacterized protein n=1 Tax=Clohesyomyces aquaticus TaxID=1231657 RepID=A0A1Y1YQ70_9PLEO|nr:hypothetical protein BCR34DRAFT_116320 [Clohesyomyces aquaticus]
MTLPSRAPAASSSHKVVSPQPPLTPSHSPRPHCIATPRSEASSGFRSFPPFPDTYTPPACSAAPLPGMHSFF